MKDHRNLLLTDILINLKRYNMQITSVWILDPVFWGGGHISGRGRDLTHFFIVCVFLGDFLGRGIWDSRGESPQEIAGINIEITWSVYHFKSTPPR